MGEFTTPFFHTLKIPHLKFLKYYKPILGIFFLATLSFNVTAQDDIDFNNSVPTDLMVCENSEQFTVEFSNISGSVLSNSEITITLPDGVKYETGTLAESSTFNVQELNISNLSEIVFSMNDLPAGELVSFTFEATAHFEAYTGQLNGNVFSNQITVNYQSGSESDLTDSYNIFYPSLSITNVNPMAHTVFVGETFTRTVTIVNGGYGSISSFILKNTYDNNLTLDAVDVGTLNASGTEISFSPADFVGIGNGDGRFDLNESLVVTQTMTAVGCNNTQDKLTAYWGCDGDTSPSNVRQPITNVQLFAPDLTITSKRDFNTCLDGLGDAQGLTILNEGTGPANEVEIEIIPRREDLYTRVDVSSLTYTLNGNTVALIPSATQAATGYACLGNDPIDGFTVTLPNIQPGEALNLNWNNYTCATQECGPVNLIGWRYESSYTDMCGNNQYNSSGNGIGLKRKNFSTFYESPSGLADGEVGAYTLIFNSAVFTLPEGDAPYFEAVINIPNGLVWSGDAADLSFVSGQNIWTASTINFDNATKVLTARYDLPIPDDFVLPLSQFDLNLSADCSQGGGLVGVGMQLFYIMDENCPSPYRIPLTCKVNPQTMIQCPGTCDEGLVFDSFEITRTSFGTSDNDLDGLPDAVNNLNMAEVKTNRVMVGDTFETTFNGSVKTSVAYPSFGFGYARSSIPRGNKLKVISARVNILDKSTGQTLTCDDVAFTTNLSSGIRTVNFDFSATTLAANGCTDFAGFVMEDEDEIELIAEYKVSGNIGGKIEQLLIENDFYISDAANGSIFKCTEDWNGNFTMVGYYYRVNKAEQYNVTTCTQTISQNYYMSIGKCCGNYAGGNVFPYEYRNWANVKDLRVEIPEGYTFVSGSVEQWRTTSTNAKVQETANVTPTNVSSTELIFDLEQYAVTNGGTLNLSDDGFNGEVNIELKPECTVDETANNPVDWFFTFQENDILGGDITSEKSGQTDHINYAHADLETSTTFPIQDGISTTVSWDVSIRSRNAAASNSWMFFQDVSGNIAIEEVVDLSNNNILPSVNGFYQMDDFSQNQIKNYRITASYSDCEATEIKLLTGNSCDGYFATLDDYDCAYEEMNMYIDIQESGLQIYYKSFANPLDECDNNIKVELELLSSKIGSVNDVFVKIIQPSTQTMTVQPGSVEVLYPIGNDYSSIGDPTQQGLTYTIIGEEMDPIIGANGLTGVTDVTKNRVKIKFNVVLNDDYKSGEILKFELGGRRPCGDPLPTLAVSFDPNANFATPEGIGLDDISDAWAMAWGDYDGDENVDLFVTNYNENTPNFLYHNNGDGTFNKVTSGQIATDLASSLAASWGDYDNDGDLDLFVANNIGFENFLYRNDGGNLIRIMDDPIVNEVGYAHGASWVDYDGDGFLDMFVTEYFSTKFNHLFHNNGDGTFSKANSAAPTLEASFSVSGVWGDYNNDNLPDLFVSNSKNSNNSLYKNTGNGTFLKINTGDIVNDGGNSVGASWGDYDNDGDLDLFVANAGNQNNFLYENLGNENFSRVTSGVVVNDAGHSHGSSWADYDNDGDLDLFVSNDQGQPNFFYANKGDGTFSRIENNITQDIGDSFGAGWADYDNDGDVDLYITNHNLGENFIYQNGRGKCQNKACITLVGVNSNRSALGTKIHLKANIYGKEVWQMRELTGQSGGGIGGQNELKTIIGIGDATQVDSIIIAWNSGYRQSLSAAEIPDDCFTIKEGSTSEICGVAYYDENENCQQDENEVGIAGMSMMIYPLEYTVITDSTGAYSFIVPPGIYKIEQLTADTNWEPTCESILEVEVIGIDNQYCENNFGNKALCPNPDLEVEISATPHRVGFENLVAITYRNTGPTTATNVKLEVFFDNNILPLESSIPWNEATPDSRIWELGNVPMGTSVTIYVKDSVLASTAIGVPISIKAEINCTESDCDFADNVTSDTQPAVGAIDPNDILVNPLGYIDNEQELVYKIRFQNVGNASVSTVRIEDRLPLELDLTTLEIGIASHSYKFEIQDGNRLVWTFENINMPDSLSNEPESHGFVMFKILPKRDLLEGTTIENSASIFFDFAAELETNTVINIIGKPFGEVVEAGQLQIIPNPMQVESTIRIISEQGVDVQIESIFVYDLVGRELYQEVTGGSDEIQLKRDGLPEGYYLIRALGVDGKEYTGKVIVTNGE